MIDEPDTNRPEGTDEDTETTEKAGIDTQQRVLRYSYVP